MSLNITPTLEAVSDVLPLLLVIILVVLGFAYLKKLY